MSNRGEYLSSILNIFSHSESALQDRFTFSYEIMKTRHNLAQINPLVRTESRINKLKIVSEKGSVWGANKMVH